MKKKESSTSQDLKSGSTKEQKIELGKATTQRGKVIPKQ